MRAWDADGRRRPALVASWPHGKMQQPLLQQQQQQQQQLAPGSESESGDEMQEGGEEEEPEFDEEVMEEVRALELAASQSCCDYC